MERAIEVSNAVVINPHDEVLLLQRSESLKQPGLWGLPGGMIDDNESPRDAAFRELREETGITGSDLECRDEKAYTVTNPDQRIWMYVMLARLISHSVVRLNPHEHTDYGWEGLDTVTEREDLLRGVPVIINSLLFPEAGVDHDSIIQPTFMNFNPDASANCFIQEKPDA